jgi:glycerol uptake facilitator-like aquaporin
MCALYIVCEVIGASLGFGLLFSLTPKDLFEQGEDEPGLCMTLPHSSYSVFEAFFVEYVLTTALVLVVCGVWHPENRNLGDSAPLRIGDKINPSLR